MPCRATIRGIHGGRKKSISKSAALSRPAQRTHGRPAVQWADDAAAAKARQEFKEEAHENGHDPATFISFGRSSEPLDIGDDVEPIPPRGWLLGNTFCRSFISGLVAQGAAGKTAVRLLQALSLASGRSLSGEHVFQRGRVLLVCL